MCTVNENRKKNGMRQVCQVLKAVTARLSQSTPSIFVVTQQEIYKEARFLYCQQQR